MNQTSQGHSDDWSRWFRQSTAFVTNADLTRSAPTLLPKSR
jgi:hypothetical protein